MVWTRFIWLRIMDHWQALVNTVLNFRIPRKTGNFSLATFSFSGNILYGASLNFLVLKHAMEIEQWSSSSTHSYPRH